MNQYGLIAQQHWQEYRPQSVAELANPEEFFTERELGLDVQREVQDRWRSHPAPAATVVKKSCLERTGRLIQFRREIEGDVLRELVLLPAGNALNLADDLRLSPAELADELWREFHLFRLVEGRTRSAGFEVFSCTTLPNDEWPQLQELTNLPGFIFVSRRGEYV
ncbi:hypothetical protein [Streptomyces sp. NPDC058861]|uniref:hypothetical protein n=1 Tax=Streptomyces sp. NPDC058861 TaxID=3346653 RepID=UPI0036C49A54